MIHSRNVYGWPSLVLESDGVVIAVPQNIGPRLMHFGPDADTNLFYLEEATRGTSGEATWILRGGHRLWAAPEDHLRTAQPDNDPVEITADDDGRGIRASGALETATGLVKHIHVRSVAERVIAITHTIENRNLWPIELAPWSLSVFPRGGRAMLPLPAPDLDSPRMTSSYTINSWPYTRWHEPCWQWQKEGLILDTSLVTEKQKVGFGGAGRWLAMANEQWLVVKLGAIPEEGRFTDLGAKLHIYADASILELETLGELTTLQPGAAATLVDYMTFQSIKSGTSASGLWKMAGELAAKLHSFLENPE